MEGRNSAGMLRVGTVTVLLGVNALSCCRNKVYSPPLLPHQVFSWLLVARLHALPKRPSGKIHTNTTVLTHAASTLENSVSIPLAYAAKLNKGKNHWTDVTFRRDGVY